MQHEVFVIGCPRSGTTAVAQALRRIGYAGVSGEGHVLTLVPLLRNVIADYRTSKEASPADYAVRQFPWEGLEAVIDAHIHDFFASLYDGKPFVDKTPYDALDYPVEDIRRIWPNARILYCQRNGIDNVNSQLRKFSEAGLSFAAACMNWASAIRCWLKVAGSVTDISMVVEHSALLDQPEVVAQQIGAFLHFDEMQTRGFAEALHSDFPEFTGGLSEVSWSENERHLFLQLCGPWMRRSGYDMQDPFVPTSRSTAVVLSMPPLLASAQLSAGSGLFDVHEREISLHPPMPGGESRLTFPKLRLSNCRHFITYVDVRSAMSERVRFRLEISPAAESSETIRYEIDVDGGAKRAWTLSLPPNLEVADVTLITSMAPGAGHNQFAWAVFSNPRLV